MGGVPFAWAQVAGAEPHTCVCCLFPCLFSWSSPSPLSVLLNKTCWSSPAQPKPMAALVASACHKVPQFGPWWRQKMWGALNYTHAKATIAVLSGTVSPFLTCTPQSLRLWTFWGRGLIFAHPSAEIRDYNPNTACVLEVRAGNSSAIAPWLRLSQEKGWGRSGADLGDGCPAAKLGNISGLQRGSKTRAGSACA